MNITHIGLTPKTMQDKNTTNFTVDSLSNTTDMIKVPIEIFLKIHINII